MRPAGADADPDWSEAMGGPYRAACRRVGRRIPAPLRSAVDAEDIVMDAVASLVAAGSPPPDADALAIVARRRLADALRRSSSTKRGGRLRPVGLDAAAAGDGRTLYPRRAAHGPEAGLVAAEALAGILDGRTEAERAVIPLLAEGHDGRSAAPLAGLGERTVQRTISRIRGQELA